jgi:hypothetical protein
MMDEVAKKKILSFGFRRALFSFLSAQRFCIVSLGLTLHGWIQSTLVWHGLVKKFKMASHI